MAHRRRHSRMCMQSILDHVCVFGPTTLASLLSGVVLFNRSTTTKDSTTDIEKTYQKGAPNESNLMEA